MEAVLVVAVWRRNVVGMSETTAVSMPPSPLRVCMMALLLWKLLIRWLAVQNVAAPVYSMMKSPRTT